MLVKSIVQTILHDSRKYSSNNFVIAKDIANVIFMLAQSIMQTNLHGT